MEETSYPKLRRPKRPLCYLTSTEKPLKQWNELLTMEDVDRIFDELDSPSDDLAPCPSPPCQDFCSRQNLPETAISPIPQEGQQMVPDEDALQPVSRSSCHKLDVDFIDLARGPVKTSSPVDEMLGVRCVERQCDEKTVPQVLLSTEDEARESTPPPSEKLHCNGQVTEESGISGLETPPEKLVLPKLTSTGRKPQASQKQEGAERPAVVSRQAPAPPAPDSDSESLHRKPPADATSHVENNMMTFLQKLQEEKLACSRKSVFPLQIPPPEPEDDFLILEDDTFQFSIPSKYGTSKRQKQSRTSSSDKDTSTDKENAQRTPGGQEGLEKANRKLGSQAASQKTKAKKKEKEKNDKRPEKTTDEMLHEQEKPTPQKNQLNKFQSEASDSRKSSSEERASAETEPAQKTQTKAPKSKHSKERSKSMKTTRTEPLGSSRKLLQRSDADDVDVNVMQTQSGDRVNAEDRCAPAENNLAKSDTNENAKLAESPGISSEDSEVLQKRKRKPPGQWWMTDPPSLSSDETDRPQPKVKRSKQKSKEPDVATVSPVKDQKNKALKRRTRKEFTVSNQHANKAKGKEIKQTKKRNKSEDTPQKEEGKEEQSKATDEQQPEEEEVQEVEQDLGESSSSLLNHRDQTADSGQIFQKVYHRTPTRKASTTEAAPDSHRRPEELLREAEPAKRRRKPTGSWWLVSSAAHHVEIVSPKRRQPALNKSKPHKKRKEQHKQDQPDGLSSNSIVDISSKPAGDTPVLPLKLKPLSTLNTVKGCPPKLTDIYKRGIKTPVKEGRRETPLKNRRAVASHPAQNCVTRRKTDAEAPGEVLDTPSSLHKLKTPQESSCQVESRSPFFRSGPSSMIVLQEYEEDEGTTTSLTCGVQAELCPSDLCSPPLKPLILQPKDKSNLAEWFKSLWPSTAKSDAVVTPEQFDWYFHQDKAMGLQVEQNTAAFCNGKMMLGSQMKKPLWVDHSATTVFNLLTSSVSVIVDGSESRFSPGQSFVVNCGHAYSIKNTTSLPAMLYFTRVPAGSSAEILSP